MAFKTACNGDRLLVHRRFSEAEIQVFVIAHHGDDEIRIEQIDRTAQKFHVLRGRVADAREIDDADARAPGGVEQPFGHRRKASRVRYPESGRLTSAQKDHAALALGFRLFQKAIGTLPPDQPFPPRIAERVRRCRGAGGKILKRQGAAGVHGRRRFGGLDDPRERLDEDQRQHHRDPAEQRRLPKGAFHRRSDLIQGGGDFKSGLV
ncbi:MAG: hypothetical protein M5R36_05595 [Deltaproteobacteria bacterium]|nr:hypothetical protein [Deltaproteobacteria bacterium]